MIEKLKNLGWKQFGGLVLIVIIIIAFGFGGFGGGFSTNNQNNIAKINKTNVTTQDFLTVGTCGINPFTMYGTGSFADEMVNNSIVVSCNNPHSFEVFDYFTYTPGENESLSEVEDAIADYCYQNADILYSNFPDYESTYFKYIANPEKLKQKGYEVIYLTDTVDEWVMNSLQNYKEKPLQSIAKEDLDLDTEKEKKIFKSN